jgi:hypothetical protein
MGKYDDAVIRDLEDDLIHASEYIPADSQCPDCQRIKAQGHALTIQRAFEPPHEESCICRRCTSRRVGKPVAAC